MKRTQSIPFGGIIGSSASSISCTLCAGARVIALLVLFLSGGLIVFGQQITGSIKGTVKDQQSAVVPTATVTAINVETGLTRSTPTDSEGGYYIQYLPVGTYRVEVNATGFKKFLQENVVLGVDQTQALNVTLEVGGESQTVTVTDAPVLIDTNSAVLGRT